MMDGNISVVGALISIEKTDSKYCLQYEEGEKAIIEILNSHVFRYYMSPKGIFLQYPYPNNCKDTAQIIIKKNYKADDFKKSTLKIEETLYTIDTGKIKIILDKLNGTMSVYDKRSNREVLKELKPLSYEDYKTTQVLKQRTDEFFFGGGMQNGRFTHKGEVIDIINTNVWTDGGVTSPCPFYWSSYGYGVIRNTWKPGSYDFGLESSDTITTMHCDGHFDAYYIINIHPRDILHDYYQLTGNPIKMPEYAFYEAHLNTFNRNYWVRVSPNIPGAILYEDGYYYKCYQPQELGDKEGILESLNGEKDNYQFSARAMIDRYEKYDMPLGWFIPNDGYGSGYGQTNTLDGDIKNLKNFADYARKKGVEVALWTESNLEPVNPGNPVKGDRDLNKEVRVAGVVALKCDVAWIGEGYSFGLTAVEKATKIFVSQTNNRPLIIMVDGWAGTQRYAGIWSGDQCGGQWEYIRFHIPTYIGTGLSGLPIVGSDMDGIFDGGCKEVNIRDFQWKTFTPLQLNMDGWSNTLKTPFSFDEEATTINRAYLKMKSMMLPYNCTISHESIIGLPMLRAMFLEFPSEHLAYTIDCQYQFMWGPSILVAPIYKEETFERETVRNGIFLPDENQVWIDFFTGKKYMGGKFLNNYRSPLWKIPIFVKDGAILPLTDPNNNPNEIKRNKRILYFYPSGKTNFEIFEDDGKSVDYLEGKIATTKITCVGPKSNEEGDLFIEIGKTDGYFVGIEKQKTTILKIKATKNVTKIKAAINSKSIEIIKAKSEEEFESKDNVYFFKNNFVFNPYFTSIGNEDLKQEILLIKIQDIDVTLNDIQIKIQNYSNKDDIFSCSSIENDLIKSPPEFHVVENKTTPWSISLLWGPVEGVKYYEVERDGAIFTNLLSTRLTFDGFNCDSNHLFRIRSVSDCSVSKWSEYITATTKENPLMKTVKGVLVTCNTPCQPNYEICKLTDRNERTMWHTHWGMPCRADTDAGNYIELCFDLGNVIEIERVEYIPREDAGNGTFLTIQYQTSLDNNVWSSKSERIYWDHDPTTKVINMKGEKFRYLKMFVLHTLGGFGSGRHIYFYKK